MFNYALCFSLPISLNWLTSNQGYGRFATSGDPMAETIHPFYESHRGAMEAAMRHRFDLAEAMLCERAHLSNIGGIRQEVMDEFDIVPPKCPMSEARQVA
jgi:hypothetical protein